ncbi:hypothetical protein Mapa_014947 [Marchantia paleacea]|nr:hypothetical protein Mapa_014947 [Marchantia paleacea]
MTTRTRMHPMDIGPRGGMSTNHTGGPRAQKTSSSDNNNHHGTGVVARELQTLETLLTIDENMKHKKGSGGAKPHVQGTGLEIEDLTYTVVKKHKKDGKWVTREVDLLHGISGHASKGQVTAVMGPSGAGKSTFLDALAGRIASGSLGGLITVDGQPVSPSMMKRMSAYVMQDDQLFPMLTVWETLWFAAEVRLSQTMSRDEKRDRVMKLIDQLGLTNAQNTYIGDEGTRGISGGEKRRVSIGVDIIHEPSLLFLDEPTSGLDSTSAFSVMERIQNIAEEGSTVLLTIHQPSYRIQQLLNHLVILARGKLIYAGSPSYLGTHLASFGREVPRGENSIEYLLDVIQEYDSSTLGLEPLVQFNKDGVKPDDGHAVFSDKNFQAMEKSFVQNSPVVRKQVNHAHSPLKLFGKNFDESVEVLENGSASRQYNYFDDLDDAYDHSLTRDPPKLASFYYNGLLEGLAGKFTPMRTPVRSTPSRPAAGAGNAVYPGVSTLGGEIGPATPTPGRSDFNAAADHAFDVSESFHDIYGPKFANDWWREVVILVVRNFKNIQRTPELFLSRQMVLTVMGFMMATLFLKIKPNLEGVTQLLSFFIFTVCLFFFSSNDAVPTFIQERFIYIRETSHNAYRASSYVVAGVITYLPFLAIQAMTYCLITWWALKLDGGAPGFFFFFLVLYVSLLATNSFVMFISALVPNYILGYAAVIAFTALFFLTCGYFLKRSHIPIYWQWLHYLSTIKYPYEALLLNEFGDKKSQTCYFRAAQVGDECELYGLDLLKDLAITKLDKWQCLLILLGWAFFYRVMFYFVLRFGSKNQRH